MLTLLSYLNYELPTLKKNWGLDKIHEVSEQEINMMCMVFHFILFSQSEYVLSDLFSDRNIYHELYRLI